VQHAEDALRKLHHDLRRAVVLPAQLLQAALEGGGAQVAGLGYPLHLAPGELQGLLQLVLRLGKQGGLAMQRGLELAELSQVLVVPGVALEDRQLVLLCDLIYVYLVKDAEDQAQLALLLRQQLLHF